jgi:hypothetical protein
MITLFGSCFVQLPFLLPAVRAEAASRIVGMSEAACPKDGIIYRFFLPNDKNNKFYLPKTPAQNASRSRSTRTTFKIVRRASRSFFQAFRGDFQS